MTAPYKGKSEPWTKVCTSEDWTLTTLDVLGGRKGITNEFRYHTLGVQILLGIIRITSGMNVLDFANEYLFKPLGIEPRSNAGCESKEDQFEYLMNKNDHGRVGFWTRQVCQLQVGDYLFLLMKWHRLVCWCFITEFTTIPAL